jgi:hypothetical protein
MKKCTSVDRRNPLNPHAHPSIQPTQFRNDNRQPLQPILVHAVTESAGLRRAAQRAITMAAPTASDLEEGKRDGEEQEQEQEQGPTTATAPSSVVQRGDHDSAAAVISSALNIPPLPPLGYGRHATATSHVSSLGSADEEAGTPAPPVHHRYHHHHHHHRRRSGGSGGGSNSSLGGGMGGPGGPTTPTTAAGVGAIVSQSFQLSWELVRALSASEGLWFCQICREYETQSDTFRLSNCAHRFCRGALGAVRFERPETLYFLIRVD